MKNMIISLINIIAPCITAVASCIAIVETRKNAKESIETAYKQIEITKSDSIRQEQRYQEEKKYLEMQDRLREQPFFTLSSAERSKISDNRFLIDITFRNEGRDKSYETYAGTESKKCNSVYPDREVVFHRVEAIRNPIVKVDHEITTTWCLNEGKDFENCVAVLPLNFEDGSGREYTQDFKLAISLVDGKIHADALAYSKPVLRNK